MNYQEAPERWFRLFCQRRPAVAAKILGVDVRVRALTRHAEGLIADECASLPPARAIVRYRAGIIAASVVSSDGEPVFASAAALSKLTEARLGYVWKAVADAMAIVAPPRTQEFVEALRKGAEHDSNATVVSSLGGSADYAYGFSVVRMTPRPDRFYGVPLAELTDGQWDAYWAARHVVVAREKR